MKEENLYKALQEYFGFSKFKDGQKETLLNLLQQRSTLSILPTGTGKSLCYQFYGKYTKQAVLIISPLISLMQDQVEQMKYNKISNTVALTSKLSGNERDYVLKHLNQFQFIFASPEILQNAYIFNRIKQINIGLMVVDEAHCIAQWGPDFRPDYLLLGEIRKKLNNPLVLALTATATPDVASEIKKRLNFTSNDVEIRYSVDRSNIYLATEILSSASKKDERLLELISQIKGPGLIYFSSKRKADEIAQLINQKTSLIAASYHADLNIEDRFSIQHQFIDNKLDVICATSAFGMGVNKKDIRYVIHYHLPGDLESYVQEIGRAGRDGKQSIAILLYAKGDEEIQRQIQLGSIPNDHEIDYYYKNQKLLENVQDENLLPLKTYISLGVNENNLQNFFAKRKEDKNKALFQMLRYVNTEGCKRQFILNYFQDQKSIMHSEKCCQNNGQYDLNKLALEYVNSSEKEVNLIMPYQQRLKKLFHVE